jgi:hypothetical protein
MFEADVTTALFVLLIVSLLLAAAWWLVSWPGVLVQGIGAHP